MSRYLSAAEFFYTGAGSWKVAELTPLQGEKEGSGYEECRAVYGRAEHHRGQVSIDLAVAATEAAVSPMPTDKAPDNESGDDKADRKSPNKVSRA